MTKQFDTPILFMIFNRLDTARAVLAAIKKVKPSRLFIAADGPRLGVPGEEQRCRELRKYILENIDWDCRVETLFRPENLGIQRAPRSSLDWFFRANESGIILEDDCLPNDSFFPFCAKLLKKYQDDPRIMHISGNFFQPQPIGAGDYYFSRIPHIWGWATWRRAWEKYDLDMKTYEQFLSSRKLRQYFPDRYSQTAWQHLFDQVYYKKSTTWDFQWTYALFDNGGLAINPNRNLVRNIGFGPQAENCLDPQDRFANLPTTELDFPLRVPATMNPNLTADRYTTRHNFHFSLSKYILVRLCLFSLIQSLYKRLKRLS